METRHDGFHMYIVYPSLDPLPGGTFILLILSSFLQDLVQWDKYTAQSCFSFSHIQIDHRQIFVNCRRLLHTIGIESHNPI